jgi:hypothetical protein
MTAQVLLAAFLLADLLAVGLALANLHRQRCIDDYLDLRYRDHPDRHRRAHLRR